MTSVYTSARAKRMPKTKSRAAQMRERQAAAKRTQEAEDASSGGDWSENESSYCGSEVGDDLGLGHSEVKIAKVQDALLAHMDLLSDRRSKGRFDYSISSIRSALATIVLTEDFKERQQDTMHTALLRAYASKPHAASCLALYFVQFGDEAEEGLEDTLDKLCGDLNDDTIEPEAKIDLVEAVAMICFLAGDDGEDLPTCLHLMAKLAFGQRDGSLASAALAGWALLLTRVSEQVAMANFTRHGTHLMRLLSDVKMPFEVKVAAGEALAVLAEVAELDANQLTESLEDLVATIRQLASHSDKSQSKAYRASRKAYFRSLLGIFEDGEAPEEIVQLQGEEPCVASGWCEMRQLAALRSVLGGGLSSHLSGNMVVRQVFGLGEIVLEPCTTRPDGLLREKARMASRRDREKSRAKDRGSKAAQAYYD